MNKKEKVPIYQKCALTIEEAAEYSNIGQNKLAEILKTPRCTFVLYVGKKKFVHQCDICIIEASGEWENLKVEQV